MQNDNFSPYKIINGDSTGFYEEKKSRFISYLSYVESEDEASSFIAGIKKKHYDARHNCSAMIIGPQKDLLRSNDDGEPSGTAGKPILEALNGSGLTNIVCVVTRYFGGTLLGTGGLVRAYTKAVLDALENADISTVTYCADLRITIGYPLNNSLKFFLDSKSIRILENEYGENVTYKIRIPFESKEEIKKDLVELAQGQIILDDLGEGYNPL